MTNDNYWKDQCKFCKTNNCELEQNVNDFIVEIISIQKYKGINGNLRFNCDNFIIDPSKFINYINS